MGTLMMRPLRAGRSYKDIANCTLDILRFAISTYSGLISMPTACRPRRSATSKVVPLPAKGSRTMHLPEPSLSGQSQVGSRPTVSRWGGATIVPLGCVLPNLPIFSARSERLITIGSLLTTLTHGARHFGQAFGLLPARMASSGIFSGNTAKWLSGYGCVAMVQTLRLFRVGRSILGFCPTFGLVAAVLPVVKELPLYPATAGSAMASAS